MDVKSVLILGAGFMQGVAIREAKKIGLRVVAVDGNPNAVCAKEADVFENIDLKNVEALTAFAKAFQEKLGLDAVFTAATDFSYSVAKIAEACNLKSHSVVACENATNKVLMRECLKKANLFSVDFFSITKHEFTQLKQIFEASKLEFPLVVKPADNMGARGCKKVVSFAELKFAVETALAFSRTETAIVEKFIEGKEYSIEGLIIGEKFYVTALADRHIFFPPFFIETGHSIPANISKKDTRKLCEAFEKGTRALGLDYGVCKGDIFLSEGKVFIGEIAARLSGGYMSGWTVPYSSGINITREALLLAVGESETVCKRLEKIKLPPTRFNTKFFCAERAWISIPGFVKKVYGLHEAKKLRGVKNVFTRAEANDEVVFPTNNVEKCGNILATARSYKLASKRAESAVRKILLRLKPNEVKTETYLCASYVKSFSEIKTFEFFNSKLLNSFEKNYAELTELFELYKTQPDFFILTRERKKLICDEIINSEKMIFKKLKTNKGKTELVILFPQIFSSILKKLKDVQGRQLRKALTQMFMIEPNLEKWLIAKKDLQVNKKFWLMFLRGGIQGALYVYDSEK